MVNKGLEMMEAHWLFKYSHGEDSGSDSAGKHFTFCGSLSGWRSKGTDGGTGYALAHCLRSFQEERECYREQRIDFSKVFSLHFFPPSLEDFPGLALGMEAGAKGGSMPTVYNAANEESVRLFLEDKIRFMEIPRSIAHCMKEHEKTWIEFPSVEEIFETEQWAREEVRRLHKEDKN